MEKCIRQLFFLRVSEPLETALMRSISFALWVDAYDAHKPTHGGK